MAVYTIISTSVSQGSDEAELDLVVDEFSAEAEATGYARRMADETLGMAEQLSLDFEYSHVAVYNGDVSEEQADPSHPGLVGMWWYAEEGAEWASADSLAAVAVDTAEAASPAGTH